MFDVRDGRLIPKPSVRKTKRRGDLVWRVTIPAGMLLGHETGLYRRRTFAEAIKLLDFYLARSRTPRLVERGRAYDYMRSGR